MTWTAITIKSGYNVEEAWSHLESLGFTPLFSSEEPDGTCEIVVSGEVNGESLLFCRQARPYAGPQDIDWTAQWEAHGHHFYDGAVHIDVTPERTLKLVPGPGFGDLSHPTTHLALALMTDQVKDRYVLDIGCGSGILTLAAAALGARHAYGVDIDEQAISHATSNAILNSLEATTTFSLPQQLSPQGPWVIVINMIWSEQRLAWPDWLPIASTAEAIIVSGILITEREAYLKYVQGWGWQLTAEQQKDGWLGLRFNLRNELVFGIGL